MKSFKERLKAIPWLRRSVQTIKAELAAMWSCKPEHILRHIVRKERTQVVQIGSNDGHAGDPLFALLNTKEEWRCLFVEPVPYLFARLVESRGRSDRFKFENAAINDGEVAKFYWVDPSAKCYIPDLPQWFEQLGSFDRGHTVRHLGALSEQYIISTEIHGLGLTQLFKKHGLEKVDILHLDTEGHDWKILSQLDLNTYEPSVILFEHKHLPTLHKVAALKFLEGRYRTFLLGQDFMAIHQSIMVHKSLYRLRRKEVFSSTIATMSVAAIPAGAKD